MKAKKLISTFAKDDLSDASKWYEKQQKGLGNRFLNEVKAAFEVISANPVFKYATMTVVYIIQKSSHIQFIINISLTEMKSI
jgi:hypothetical protein